MKLELALLAGSFVVAALIQVELCPLGLGAAVSLTCGLGALLLQNRRQKRERAALDAEFKAADDKIARLLREIPR